MSPQETEISPEIIAAVQELVPQIIGVDFATMLEQYQLENEGVTEKDLVSEILEAGENQADNNAAFEDVVTIGVIAIGGPLGLV